MQNIVKKSILLSFILLTNNLLFASDKEKLHAADSTSYVLSQIQENIRHGTSLNPIKFYDTFLKTAQQQNWQDVDVTELAALGNKSVAALEPLSHALSALDSFSGKSPYILNGFKNYINDHLAQAFSKVNPSLTATPKQKGVMVRTLIRMGQQEARRNPWGTKTALQWADDFNTDRDYRKLDFSLRNDIFLKTLIAYTSQEKERVPGDQAVETRALTDVYNAFAFDETVRKPVAALQKILKNFQAHESSSPYNTAKPKEKKLFFHFDYTLYLPGTLKQVRDISKKSTEFLVTPNVRRAIRNFLDDESLVSFAPTAKAIKSDIKNDHSLTLRQLIWKTDFTNINSFDDSRLTAIFNLLSEADKIYLKAMVDEIFNKNPLEDVRKQYMKAAALGSQSAMAILKNAILEKDFERKLGFSNATGRQYLEERVRAGDQAAQRMLNNAAYYRDSIFTSWEGETYLEERAAAGDLDAQSKLNEAALNKKHSFTETTGRQYLEERVKVGDLDAQSKLNEAALEKLLGFTETTGRQYLEDRIKVGDQDAQSALNKAASEGKLGFMPSRSRKYFEDYAVKKSVNHYTLSPWTIIYNTPTRLAYQFQGLDIIRLDQIKRLKLGKEVDRFIPHSLGEVVLRGLAILLNIEKNKVR